MILHKKTSKKILVNQTTVEKLKIDTYQEMLFSLLSELLWTKKTYSTSQNPTKRVFLIIGIKLASFDLDGGHAQNKGTEPVFCPMPFENLYSPNSSFLPIFFFYANLV